MKDNTKNYIYNIVDNFYDGTLNEYLESSLQNDDIEYLFDAVNFILSIDNESLNESFVFDQNELIELQEGIMHTIGRNFRNIGRTVQAGGRQTAAFFGRYGRNKNTAPRDENGKKTGFGIRTITHSEISDNYRDRMAEDKAADKKFDNQMKTMRNDREIAKLQLQDRLDRLKASNAGSLARKQAKREFHDKWGYSKYGFGSSIKKGIKNEYNQERENQKANAQKTTSVLDRRNFIKGNTYIEKDITKEKNQEAKSKINKSEETRVKETGDANINDKYEKKEGQDEEKEDDKPESQEEAFSFETTFDLSDKYALYEILDMNGFIPNKLNMLLLAENMLLGNVFLFEYDTNLTENYENPISHLLEFNDCENNSENIELFEELYENGDILFY